MPLTYAAVMDCILNEAGMTVPLPFHTDGQDGVVRAFHNLCRHRGARVVDGVQGSCRGAIVCPFHGWVYNLDGTLRGASRPESFGGIERDRFHLKSIEMELFHGFIFLRFEPGPQPPVADLLAAFAADFAAYRSAELVSDGPSRWISELPVNWKSVRDVDNEGYHVPLAHPGLQDLYGRDYQDHQLQGGINFSRGMFGDRPGRTWSVRHYVKLSQDPEGLSPHLQKAWTYYGLFPATVFAFTPEGVQFYHEIPLSAGKTRADRQVVSVRQRNPATAAGAISRNADRPRHLGRGPAADDLVERIDGQPRLRRLSPVRSGIRAARASRPAARPDPGDGPDRLATRSRYRPPQRRASGQKLTQRRP
jgi:phenylpropionate dioxygenase-like ring-hydroxylating dioxygenase large terminal subunit